jgi:hypothetical protein
LIPKDYLIRLSLQTALLSVKSEIKADMFAVLFAVVESSSFFRKARMVNEHPIEGGDCSGVRDILASE